MIVLCKGRFQGQRDTSRMLIMELLMLVLHSIAQLAPQCSCYCC